MPETPSKVRHSPQSQPATALPSPAPSCPIVTIPVLPSTTPSPCHHPVPSCPHPCALQHNSVPLSLSPCLVTILSPLVPVPMPSSTIPSPPLPPPSPPLPPSRCRRPRLTFMKPPSMPSSRARNPSPSSRLLPPGGTRPTASPSPSPCSSPASWLSRKAKEARSSSDSRVSSAAFASPGRHPEGQGGSPNPPPVSPGLSHPQISHPWGFRGPRAPRRCGGWVAGGWRSPAPGTAAPASDGRGWR